MEKILLILKVSKNKVSSAKYPDIFCGKCKLVKRCGKKLVLEI